MIKDLGFGFWGLGIKRVGFGDEGVGFRVLR
jgi:hypothetical protein